MVISFAYDVQVDHSYLCTIYSSHIYLSELEVSRNHQCPFALVLGEIFLHAYIVNSLFLF